MSSVTFRNYKPSDYPALKEMLREAELFVTTWDAKTRLDKRIREKPDSILLAIKDEKVVGNIYIVDDVLPFVFRLAVKKEYQKQGIGKSLMDESLKILKKHGHTEVAIFVDEENADLQKWYKKQGFKDAKTWKCMWKGID